MAKLLKSVLSVGISAGLLYWVFKDVDFESMGARFTGIAPRYLLGFVGSLILMTIAKTFRWAALTSPFTQLPLRTHLKINCIGGALIILLPLRLGEFARPLLTAHEGRVPVTSGVGAVAVERTLDGLFATLVLFSCLAVLPESYPVPLSIQTAGYAAFGIFFGALVLIVANLLAQSRVSDLIQATLGRLAPSLATRIIVLLDAFTEGLQSLPDPKTVATIVLWTVAFWAVDALGLFWVMEGFGWDLHPVASPLLMTVIVLAIMLPAAPGFLGTFQAGILVALTIFGVSPTDAMAYGLVVYPLTLLVSISWGLFFVIQDRMKLETLLGPLYKPKTS